MRILFLGTPEFAVPSLASVIEGPDEVVGVVSQPDRPRGRGLRPLPPPVARLAREHGIEVYQPKRLHAPEMLESFRALRPDLIVTCAFGKILRSSLLDLPPEGCINVHASLLPRHRGAAPIPQMILEGDPWTGITIFRMDEGMDTGPILLQRLERMPSDATTGSLTERLAQLGGLALRDALGRIRSRTAQYFPQGEDGVTYAPRLAKEDGQIEWAQPADRLERFVRAMDPWPAARTSVRGSLLRIASLEPVDLVPGPAAPGTLLSLDPDPVVAAHPGSVRLGRVQAAGKKEMAAADWARGARLRPGESLG
jgi:methionyl-tRNA formyltransferase